MRHLPLLLFLSACGDDDPKRHGPGDSGVLPTDSGDTGSPPDTEDTGQDPQPPQVEGCRATPPTADRDRLVVVSFPYDERGRKSSAWGAFVLDTEGQLTDTGTRFELGRGFGGDVVFTPDAQVGFTVHEDGSLGVFRVGSDLSVTVVEAVFAGDFYASRVVPDPSGETLWIVDGNWAENGGGVYRATISCDDGGLSAVERVVEAKLGEDLLLTRWRLDRALSLGREVGGTAPPDQDVSLLAWGDTPTVLGGVDAFGDNDAIVADGALTFDDQYALIADNSEFSGVPTRVAVVEVQEEGLTAHGVVEVDDPVALVPSPWDDLVLVASGYSNAVFVMDRAQGASPFSLRGEVDYVGTSPQLPSGATLVSRGPLAGLALFAELTAIRPIWMKGDGQVEDQGAFATGDGYEAMTGAIGVQP